MTREQAESKIRDLLAEVHKIHKQYNPNANFLMAVMYGEDHMEFNNSYWCEDADHPINYRKGTNHE